jgi:glycosyltransferase involved in cell wall biosynthesis
MKIVSPIPRGSGAYLSHLSLEKGIPGYSVRAYHPCWEYFPPALPLLQRDAADLIHTTPDYARFFAHRGVPLVITFRNYVLDDHMQQHSSPVQRLHYRTDLLWFTRLALKRADCVTCVSHYLKRKVRQETSYDGEIHVIYNAVDTERFHPGPTRTGRTLRVLVVGNMSRRKGMQFIPEIANRLPPTVEIWYTQGWSSKGAYTRLDNLRCVGTIAPGDMPALYQQADVLLFPTVREGFGRAALEAMACGLPVVASDCSSLPELVVDGKGGFLCPVGDVEEFASRIDLLAGAPHLRREMGQFNRTRAVERFPMAKMLAEYRALFDRFGPSGTPAR